MRFTSCLFLFGLALAASAQQPAPVVLHSAFDAVKVSAADIATIDPARRKFIRYLSTHYLNGNEPERKAVWQTASFTVNGFSREKQIIRPPVVGGITIRLELDLFGIEPAAFDRLAKEGSGPKDARAGEPYFYEEKTGVEYVTEYKEILKHGWFKHPDTGKQAYGDYRIDEPVKKEVKSKTKRGGPGKQILLDGGNAFGFLRQETGSEYPIARADWFLYFSTLAGDAGYYDLLGVGESIKDFEKLVFADAETARKARAEIKGVAVKSVVALHNRTLYRMPTLNGPFGGYYWFSHDTKRGVDDRDYVQVVLNEEFDATEDIASLANGLQAYFLTDGKGKRLDVAAADVAQDSETRYQDKQVWAARNCMTCHAEGMRPIRDEVRLLSSGNLAQLAPAADAKAFKQLVDLFSTPLEPLIDRDKAQYAAAVFACNDLKPLANAQQFERIGVEYFETEISIERLAREVGVPPDLLLAGLAKVKVLPPALAGYLQTPPIASRRRDQLERALPQVYQALGYGVVNAGP